jgi:hypothetical protein
MTYHESSPPIKSYQVYEFVIVKGNSIKIIVPKELFSLYATNEKQIETINDIMKFVELARKLNLSHSDIEKSIKEYLYFESNSFLQTRKQGLSKNLETVNFNFNHILTIQ